MGQKIIKTACKYGHLEVVKKVLSYIKAPIDTAAIYWAAINGHLDIVKVLIDAKAPIDSNIIYWAARNGHLEVVKFLLDAKAPIDSSTIYGAAHDGHLDIVKVLIAAKAPIDKSTINWTTNKAIKKLLMDYYNTSQLSTDYSDTSQ